MKRFTFGKLLILGKLFLIKNYSQYKTLNGVKTHG
jgi:hypothetical protein